MSVPGRPIGCSPRTRRRLAVTASAIALLPSPSRAHVSEQAFVLLLPTDVYIAAGIAAVALTVIVLAFLPGHVSAGLFATARLPGIRIPRGAPAVTSTACLALLATLVFAGFTGSRDPLANPLPLFIWTVWWIAFPTVQGALGDIWFFVNPWTGPIRILNRVGGRAPRLTLPDRIGALPGIALLLAFGAFFLADPAPDDPDRLAWAVAAYAVVTFAGMIAFGKDAWLDRCECFTMLLRYYASLAPLRLGTGGSRIGFPGWSVVRAPVLPASQGIFVLAMLGTGSFDGLNETFWWLSRIDVNPLEFPGRSAIIAETVIGLLCANVLLVCLFGACVWAGLRLAARFHGVRSVPFAVAFGRLAMSVLPIAFGYHIAHFLTAFLVNGQYALVAASDPLASGADLFGLAGHHVTTGFFNSLDTVRTIWLTQAGAVVVGHILAILVAHAIAVDLFGSRSAAATSQVPLAAFMILYTLLGLWLLASPRGA